MPGYLQKLGSAGARIVPSRGVRTAPWPVSPTASRREPKHAEQITPSPPLTTPPGPSDAGGVSWPAPSIEGLRPASMRAGDALEQPAPPQEFQARDPSVRAEIVHSHIESAAPGSVPSHAAREAEPEPQIELAWTATNPSHAREQPFPASGPTPLLFDMATDPPSHTPPLLSDRTANHDPLCESPQPVPRMAVLKPSEPNPNKATRMPERHLQRLPRIEAVPEASTRLPGIDAALQASTKVPAAVSGLPARTEPVRTVTRVSNMETDRSSPSEETSAPTSLAQTTPPFQRAKPGLRPPLRAPVAAPAGGLTIHRLEVQIVERPPKEIIQSSYGPIAPVDNAWGWPDRRHQGRVF
jgi:hypothetical protein